jgi:hypothetical protein
MSLLLFILLSPFRSRIIVSQRSSDVCWLDWTGSWHWRYGHFSRLPFTSNRDERRHIQAVLDEIEAQVHIIAHQRVGRRRGYLPQLLRVTVASEQEARLLLNSTHLLRVSRDHVLQRVNITADRSYSALSENKSRVSKIPARGTAPYVSMTFFRSRREPSSGSSSQSKLPSTRSSSSRLPSASSGPSGLPFTISSSTVQPSEPCCPRGLPPTSCISSGLPTGSGAVSSSSDDLLRHETGLKRFEAAVGRAKSAGLSPVDVKGDGACLFRAVCLADHGKDDDHISLRQRAVSYMRQNSSFFTQFGAAEPGYHFATFDDYLDKISNPCEEVGDFVLNAIANVLQKTINVYFADCPPRSYTPNDLDDGAGINIIFRDLLISNSGHYMALIQQPSAAASSNNLN